MALSCRYYGVIGASCYPLKRLSVRYAIRITRILRRAYEISEHGFAVLSLLLPNASAHPLRIRSSPGIPGDTHLEFTDETFSTNKVCQSVVTRTVNFRRVPVTARRKERKREWKAERKRERPFSDDFILSIGERKQGA